jgi:hypothetical protein
VSDFAIVRADAIHGWLGFRDVLEVDGRVVEDRQDRLARVLMASEGRYDEASRISDESGALQRRVDQAELQRADDDVVLLRGRQAWTVSSSRRGR